MGSDLDTLGALRERVAEIGLRATAREARVARNTLRRLLAGYAASNGTLALLDAWTRLRGGERAA